MTWKGLPAIVIASGPSLISEDIDLVERSGINTIAVNNTWEKVRFAKAIYAGDGVWWKYNQAKIDIDAERWTCARTGEQLYQAKYRARFIKPGYNSGANAVELAVNVLKASTVLMLGFDCSVKKGIHHHGKHEHTSNPTVDKCELWKAQFHSLRDKTQGADIINCSRYSEVKYFVKQDLESALCALGLI